MPEPVKPEIETVSVKEPKPVPVFDHSRPAGQVFGTDHKYLEQDGHLFSFGELSRSLQRYIPEPVYVPPGRRSYDQLMTELKAVLFQMAELEVKLRTMQDNILNNLEAFQGNG